MSGETMWVNNPFFFKLFVCGGRGGVDKPRLRKTLQAVEGSLWLGLTIMNSYNIEISLGFIKT